ncbi:MAG: queuosine salvage family protein [Candidatus Moraniibacteriota bacterium]|nr:MAG: queuosine salvage family protein [Candidatus Moranbacteria bacterium]
MQQDILPTTKRIAESAKFVSIDRGALEEFCSSFSLDGMGVAEFGDVAELDIPESIGLVRIFNCVNFCFWARRGEEKWATKINGEVIDGAAGIFRAIEEMYKNGVPLLDAHFLQNLNQEKFNELLGGNVEIPLLDERVKSLNEAGEVLLRDFDGSFMKVFESAKWDTVELTNIFIKFFPSFNDRVTFEGKEIDFHKRAQLNADMINCQLTKRGEKELFNLDKLTAFADYKVPQMLRKLEILKYTPELAARVDAFQEIDMGSREEIEIRAVTIWAIERMKEALKSRFPLVTTRQLNDHLWSLGQAKSSHDKPYHRTKTIYY